MDLYLLTGLALYCLSLSVFVIVFCSDSPAALFHRRRGQFFSTGAEPSLPEKYFDRATLKNYFARLTAPIVKIPDFGHFILLDGMSSVFRLINTTNMFFFILAADFCPKNVAFARKIMAFLDSSPQPPGSYRMPMLFSRRQLSRLRKPATAARLSHTVSCVRWL